MRLFRKLFLVIAICVIGLLTSCQPNDKELFNEVVDNMNKQYNYSITMKIELSMGQLNATSTAVVDIDAESETVGKQKTIITSSGSMGTSTNTTYYEMKGTTVDQYNLVGQDWTVTSVSMSEFTDEMGESDELLESLKNNTNVVSKKDGTLPDGTKVKIYEVKINAKELFEGSFGSFGNIDGLTEQQVADIFNDVIYKYYIDVEKKQIRKLEVDMIPVLRKIYELTADPGMPFGITKASISIEFSKFNEITVTLPDVD